MIRLPRKPSDVTGKPEIDPLKRVFVPREDGLGRFVTHPDGMPYRRDLATGTIRRMVSKERGKAARRADKKARHARQKAAAA